MRPVTFTNLGYTWLATSDTFNHVQIVCMGKTYRARVMTGIHRNLTLNFKGLSEAMAFAIRELR